MINNNQNQIVVYSDGSNPSKVIIEILKKNGLEKTLDEKIKEIKEGNKNRNNNFLYIDKIAKELADKKISDEDAIIYLQEQLKITKENAKNLVDDIKIRLIPLTEKITEEKEINETVPTAAINLKISPKIEPTQNITTEKPITPTKEMPKKTIKKQSETIKKEIPNLPKKSDTYRESIE